MTYTAVNPHACCNWPRPEDAHATTRPPPHPHASPHLTNNDRLRWKTDGRPPTNGPPTAKTPQLQPGAHPDPPHPDRAPSRRHQSAKAKVKFPLQNRIFCQPQHSACYLHWARLLVFLQEQIKDIIIIIIHTPLVLQLYRTSASREQCPHPWFHFFIHFLARLSLQPLCTDISTATARSRLGVGETPGSESHPGHSRGGVPMSDT